MNARIIVNRNCRGARDRKAVGRALKRAGVKGKVHWLAPNQVQAWAKSAAEEGADLVVIGGGDGTVSAAAGAIAGTATKLAVLPLGTLNHFARDLGIPLKADDAAKVIAAGRTRPVDVAEMNGRIFVNNSAIGVYPLMVVSRDLQRRRLGRSKRFAMLVASIRTLARFNHQRLTLTVNEQEAQVDTPLLFVGNNDYRIDIAAPGQRESLSDGRLSVLVMRKKTRRGFLAATVRALLGRTRSDDMVQLKDVSRVQVASQRGSLVVSMDGEVVRVEPPLDYRIRPKALTVVVP